MYVFTQKQNKTILSGKTYPQTKITTNQTLLFMGIAVASVLGMNALASEIPMSSEFTASAELAGLETNAEHEGVRNHFPTDRQNSVPLTVRGDEPVDAHAVQRNNFPIDRSNSIPLIFGNGEESEHTMPRNNFNY